MNVIPLSGMTLGVFMEITHHENGEEKSAEETHGSARKNADES